MKTGKMCLFFLPYINYSTFILFQTFTDFSLDVARKSQCLSNLSVALTNYYYI